MTVFDHHDVFVGSTDDGHTFVVINSPLRQAHRILTQSGFTAREHQGRTLYLLPPGTATQDAHNRTGTALYALLAHTMDFVDLSSTTRWTASGQARQTAARFDLSDGGITATAYTGLAHEVLELHGFQGTPTGYALPGEIGERESVGAVARAEAHLRSLGLGVGLALGIPTPNALMTVPRPVKTPEPVRSVQPTQPSRRTR